MRNTPQSDLYDAASNLTGIARFSDLAGTVSVASTTQGYDVANRLTSITHTIATTPTATTKSYTLTYDNKSRLKTLTSVDGATTYTYDANDQLLTGSLTAEVYTYDASGNRTNGNYTTGAVSRLAYDGLYDYTYDNQGNLTTRIRRMGNDADGSHSVTYTWDTRNRLTDVVYKDPSNLTLRQFHYAYDLSNRRIAKSQIVGGSVNEQYLYAGSELAATIASTNGVVTQRYFEDGSQILAEETVGDKTRWSLTDHEGSVAIRRPRMTAAVFWTALGVRSANVLGTDTDGWRWNDDGTIEGSTLTESSMADGLDTGGGASLAPG